MGEITDGVEGAMWSWESINDHRLVLHPDVPVVLPEFIRKVVSIDPAVTSGEDSDLTGLILAAKELRDVRAPEAKKAVLEAHFWVLKDLSARYDVAEWPRVAVKLAVAENATLLVETNQGGDMNVKLLRDAARDLGLACPVIKTVRATVSKAERATPCVAKYQNGKVHHLGILEELESQQTTWVPEQSKKSPDRVDAAVHAIDELSKVAVGPVPMRSV